MSTYDTTATDIRRAMRKSLESVGQLHRSDLIAHVADVTDATADRVADELAEQKKRGEVYEVPSDDGPVVKLP